MDQSTKALGAERDTITITCYTKKNMTKHTTLAPRDGNKALDTNPAPNFSLILYVLNNNRNTRTSFIKDADIPDFLDTPSY
jgi:hypothetical protein